MLIIDESFPAKHFRSNTTIDCGISQLESKVQLTKHWRPHTQPNPAVCPRRLTTLLTNKDPSMTERTSEHSHHGAIATIGIRNWEGAVIIYSL